MGFFDFVKSKKSDSLSLEKQLEGFFLSNELQGNMNNQVRMLKNTTDQLMMDQSPEFINVYRNVVLESVESAVEVYEVLKDNGIHELNAIVILASFYLVNLSDMTLKDPQSFTEPEISNTLNTFLAAAGAAGKVDISSYNELVRIGINWLLSHPTN